MYEMKPSYFTGIEKIDKEHAKLFAYVDETYNLLQEEFLVDKYDQIVMILNELRNYTAEHFAHEEEYMESINHSNLFLQKKEHQNFIDKLAEVDLDSISELDNQDVAIMDILRFLTDWLINHIVKLDTKIGK